MLNFDNNYTINKMNTNEIFTVLLFLKINQLRKIIMLFHETLDNKYMLKLIYIRNYKTNNILKSYYNSHILYYENFDHYNYISQKKIILSLSTRELTIGINYRSLPKKVTLLFNLNVLNLSENYLKTIPNELKLLINLECLYLNINKLIKLPNELILLTKLKELSIYRNKLINLPNELDKLIYLQKFEIDDNPIYVLPTELGLLNNLKYLTINNRQKKYLSNQINRSFIHIIKSNKSIIYTKQLENYPN